LQAHKESKVLRVFRELLVQLQDLKEFREFKVL
jgi:hypothetical protein